MSTVWEESSAQTREMLDAFTVPRADKDDSSCQNHQEDTNGVVEGVRMLAINVLGSAIYGSRRSWTQASSNTKAPAGYKTTLMQAIVAIIDNHIVAVFIPPSVLSLPFMPKAIRQLGASTMEFPRHADDLIAKERGKPHGSAQNNFIGVLVKNAEDQKRQVASPSKHSSHMYLSEEEIIGNLFNFTIAAFDTLASVMAYAIMALAIHSEWQGWIMDEIDNVGQLDQAADYKTSFSLLTRCLALMVSLSAPSPPTPPPPPPSTLPTCTLPTDEIRPPAYRLAVRDSPPLPPCRPRNPLHLESTNPPSQLHHPSRHNRLRLWVMRPRLAQPL